MFKAEQLKQENIIEYIIYMLQIENVIKANDCDIQKITKNVVSQYDVTEIQKQEVHNWYKTLIVQMQLSNNAITHLSFIQDLFQELDHIHLSILDAGIEHSTDYKSKYTAISPIIAELRNILRLPGASDIQVAIRALFVYVNMKMQQQIISEETQKSIKLIVEFLELIGNIYHRVR